MLTDLQKRCLEISYKHKLSHIGSVLATVDVLDAIYYREPNALVVMGNAHAGLALYVVLEKHKGYDAEALLLQHGIHTTRDTEHGVPVTGGSLGQAETVAVGLALADPHRTVYLVTSDGATAEGAFWEAMGYAGRMTLSNLCVTIIANGYSAYGTISMNHLWNRMRSTFGVDFHSPETSTYPEWLQGLAAHYTVMDEEKYKEIMQ